MLCGALYSSPLNTDRCYALYTKLSYTVWLSSRRNFGIMGIRHNAAMSLLKVGDRMAGDTSLSCDGRRAWLMTREETSPSFLRIRAQVCVIHAISLLRPGTHLRTRGSIKQQGTGNSASGRRCLIFAHRIIMRLPGIVTLHAGRCDRARARRRFAAPGVDPVGSMEKSDLETRSNTASMGAEATWAPSRLL